MVAAATTWRPEPPDSKGDWCYKLGRDGNKIWRTLDKQSLVIMRDHWHEYPGAVCFKLPSPTDGGD